MGRTVINAVRNCGPKRLLYRLFGNKICLNCKIFLRNMGKNIKHYKTNMQRLGNITLPTCFTELWPFVILYVNCVRSITFKPFKIFLLNLVQK